MKTFPAGVSLLVLLVATVYSGPLQVSDKSTTASDATTSWYADREFNVQLWGTYLATANEYRQDRFLEADHAWGGGLDAKYFFNRYMAVGVEGYAVSRTASFTYINFSPATGTTNVTLHDTRTIGAGLATITFRYPIGASRFAPYAFAGGGFIAGGGQHVRFDLINLLGTPPGTSPIRASIDGSETEAVGQFGGGLEIRLTPHVGFISDFSWNVVDGRDNNFGMARTGINFAF
jgi:Outer membrane protein beta-barrel domain